MRDLEFYLAQPWGVRVFTEDYPDGVREWVLEIDELPGFALAGDSQAELFLKYRPSLEFFLQSYLDDGEEPPLPVPPARAVGA